MSVPERHALFNASLPVDAADPRSRRFALRRTDRGLEIYDLKFTGDVDGDPEFHGHPATRVNRDILKAWRNVGAISQAEYARLRKELPGC